MLEFVLISVAQTALYAVWRLVTRLVISEGVVGSVAPEYTTVFGLKLLAFFRIFPLKRRFPERALFSIRSIPPAVVPLLVIILGMASI